MKSGLLLIAIASLFKSCKKIVRKDLEHPTDTTEMKTSKNCIINQSGFTQITDLGIGYFIDYLMLPLLHQKN